LSEEPASADFRRALVDLIFEVVVGGSVQGISPPGEKRLKSGGRDTRRIEPYPPSEGIALRSQRSLIDLQFIPPSDVGDADQFGS